MFLFLDQYVTDSDSFWTSIHPEHWSKHNVCEWLQFCCDQYKLDANCISFSHFNISGLQLCNMTQEEFLDAAGICGEYLYFILQNIRMHGECSRNQMQNRKQCFFCVCEVFANRKVGFMLKDSRTWGPLKYCHTEGHSHSWHSWCSHRNSHISPCSSLGHRNLCAGSSAAPSLAFLLKLLNPHNPRVTSRLDTERHSTQLL